MILDNIYALLWSIWIKVIYIKKLEKDRKIKIISQKKMYGTMLYKSFKESKFYIVITLFIEI